VLGSCMPHFLLTFGDAKSRGGLTTKIAVIVDAPQAAGGQGPRLRRARYLTAIV
jgi:hypothetical protein